MSAGTLTMRPWKALHCLKPHAKSNSVHGKSRVVQITQNPHSLALRGLTKERPSRGESALAFTPRISVSPLFTALYAGAHAHSLQITGP